MFRKALLAATVSMLAVSPAWAETYLITAKQAILDPAIGLTGPVSIVVVDGRIAQIETEIAANADANGHHQH